MLRIIIWLVLTGIAFIFVFVKYGVGYGVSMTTVVILTLPISYVIARICSMGAPTKPSGEIESSDT
jgi:hypothetical protein